MRDWYESYRATLEKSVREARNVHRQAAALLAERATNADIVAATLDVNGKFNCILRAVRVSSPI